MKNLLNIKKRMKPELTIKGIGTQRFWFGIGVGFIYALVISLFFNYSREILRFFTGTSNDLIMLDKKTTLFFNIFFATFSSAIGFSITIWFWFSNPKNEFSKHRLLKRLTQVNSSLIIWVPIMMIARIGSILFVLLYSRRGYDSDLRLIENFKLLFILLPVTIFFLNWISIRIIFKTKNWILTSFILFIGISFTVHMLTSVQTQFVDNNYLSRFEEDYKMIDDEVLRAKNKYNITFQPATIKTVKQWHTKSSIEQMKQVKKAFAENRNVSIDTIILQKMIVKNFKEGILYPRKRNSFKNWPYAKPIEIFKQIQLNKTNPTKLQELVRLLNEQINLINYLNANTDDTQDLSQTERRKMHATKYVIPKVLISQMKSVIDKLKKMEELMSLEEKMIPMNLSKKKELTKENMMLQISIEKD